MKFLVLACALVLVQSQVPGDPCNALTSKTTCPDDGSVHVASSTCAWNDAEGRCDSMCFSTETSTKFEGSYCKQVVGDGCQTFDYYYTAGICEFDTPYSVDCQGGKYAFNYWIPSSKCDICAPDNDWHINNPCNCSPAPACCPCGCPLPATIKPDCCPDDCNSSMIENNSTARLIKKSKLFN